MLKVSFSIFQRARPPHDVPDVLRNQEKVGDPTEMLHLPIGVDLPVFQHIDQLVGVRLVERHAITEPKMMHNARRWILPGKDLHLAGLVDGPQVVEQKRVVARLDANDVMHQPHAGRGGGGRWR